MYMSNRIREARSAFQADDAPFRDYVLAELQSLEDKIPDLKYSFE